MMMITAAAAMVLIHSVNSFASKEKKGNKKKPKKNSFSVAWLREKSWRVRGSKRVYVPLLSDVEKYVRSF